MARSDMCGQKRTAAVGGACGEAVGGGVVGARHRDGVVGRRLSGRRCAVLTAPLRRGVRRVTGGPLMSVISELKFTPEQK
jgi:hypothetical protein